MGVVFSLPSSAHPMATFFFKDFGKDVSDILLKDRPTNEQIKVNGTYRGVKLAFTGKTTSGNKASASFEPSWSVPNYGLDLKATLNSNGNHSVNATCNNKVASGLKLDGTFTAGKNKQLAAGLGVPTVLDNGAIGKVTLGSNGIVGLSYKKR